jgi:predicted porin
MNKKLIALAIAGASLAPAAMAQTANPVTLYGRVYVTFESVEAKGGASPVARRNRVSDQSSLLGVRGTEDLGAGLKAFFQLETGFKPDQNDTRFAARNSGVGLQGGWGSVLLGRWDTPWKVATIAVDPYGDLTLSGITGVLSDGGNFDRRDQNSVQYWSPSFGGFAFRVMATANERKNDPAGVNAHDNGANVTFTRGPVYLFGAWEEHKDQAGGSGDAFGQLPTGVAAVNGVSGAKEEGWAGGGNFSIGPVKLGAQYQEFKKTGPITVARDKQKAWMGNIVFTAGNNQIFYQYMQSKDGKLNTATAEPDCHSNSLGYQYNFTRRTFFIASYVKVENNAVASCNFGANRLTAAAGQNPQGVFGGIRHIF